MPRNFIIVTKDFSGLGYAFDARNKDAGDTIIFATNPDREKLKEDGAREAFENNSANKEECLMKPFEIHRATKCRAKLRLGMSGPAGSGKTYSALLIAHGGPAAEVWADSARNPTA